MCAFPTDSDKARMAASIHPRARRAGFTLIELLIVVVIIGLLAAIAIPKFAATKTQARLAEMRSDLHNLATAQEAYTSDNNVYYAGAVPSAVLLYKPSPGIAITITEGTASGWAAIASTNQTTRTCALYIGNAAPPAPATSEGHIACSP
ncbi:MAG TPA: prepilin-type N-terminal cleavage/methylation domain-containing protein [Gemmatimonadales bacterium]|jgi:prepilin-type N-terminal cleavage/methylation domain-containing protein|nr:prepilin-type N-terminal cleavage/methylation domain-containing protein [Gemmatimonadales bacterium]